MPKRILIADDDYATRFLMEQLFQFEGFDVQLAENGATLVRLALETPPDIILSDMEMPYVSGIEATRQLRVEPRTARIPILVQSANYDVQRTALAAGAQGFFRKPVDLDELIAAVRSLLKM